MDLPGYAASLAVCASLRQIHGLFVLESSRLPVSTSEEEGEEEEEEGEEEEEEEQQQQQPPS